MIVYVNKTWGMWEGGNCLIVCMWTWYGRYRWVPDCVCDVTCMGGWLCVWRNIGVPISCCPVLIGHMYVSLMSTLSPGLPRHSNVWPQSQPSLTSIFRTHPLDLGSMIPLPWSIIGRSVTKNKISHQTTHHQPGHIVVLWAGIYFSLPLIPPTEKYGWLVRLPGYW